MQILIVDDEPCGRQLLVAYLGSLPGVTITALDDPGQALDWCRGHEPDLVVVDYAMPGMDGIAFVQALRALPERAETPLLMITVVSDRDILGQALDAGANDFVRKPFDELELLARARSLLRLRRRQIEVRNNQSELVRLATVDTLTGAASRARFLAELDHELARTRRYQTPLAVLMIDIDHFKSINDRHGHDAGDRALAAAAAALRAQLRQTDTLGRLGGEEFGVLMPQTDLGGALLAAEKMRRILAELPISQAQPSLRITASFGATCAGAGDRSGTEVLKRADVALYRAKATGRNRVEQAEPAATDPAREPAQDSSPAPGPTARLARLG